MLQCISKGIVALLLTLAVGGCRSSAQPKVQETATFDYRGLYTPSNDQEMQETMHTHHPDYDWGVWGHNLTKVVKDKAASERMYAVIDGKRDKRQFCFSSEELYRNVHDYILDQFGWGTDTYSERISIMPMDNKLACLCPDCRAKGNTAGNATPAVTAFVTRLAKEFPRHQFFTSAYHSTKNAPRTTLPKNVGVFISSIVLPMRVDFDRTAGFKEFTAMVRAWKQKCGKIYVWDYERNYDDYLSPFPCLLALQSRMRLYRQLGVRGVFINGSGDDYSTFDDMQSHVLARLMEDPDTDVRAAVSEYFADHYPITAKTLTDYYWGLEARSKATNHLLPLYGTMQEMCESYLDAAEFAQFRQRLDTESKQTSGEERKRLNALLTALAYTQLELYRTGLLPKDDDTAIEMREILKGHSELKGMVSRDESGHLIDDYLKKWK